NWSRNRRISKFDPDAVQVLNLFATPWTDLQVSRKRGVGRQMSGYVLRNIVFGFFTSHFGSSPDILKYTARNSRSARCTRTLTAPTSIWSIAAIASYFISS